MKRGRWTIPVSQVPSHITIARYLIEKTDLGQFMRGMPKPSLPGCLKFPLEYNLADLQKSILNLLEEYPAYSYPYGMAPATPFYRMIYLTYNPRSKNAQIANPVPTLKEEFPPEAIEGMTVGKDSHDDTLAIVEPTAIAQRGELKTFLEGFQRTLVRSKIVVHSGLTAKNRAKAILSWHTDESLFINARINVPVFSSDNFAIEYQTDDNQIESFDLIPGYGYVFDTEKPHCFYAKHPIDFQRISLICGFSPWFDYDSESQCWISNEHYGEVHPLELLARGFVTKFLNHRALSKISEPGKADAHSYHSVT